MAAAPASAGIVLRACDEQAHQLSKWAREQGHQYACAEDALSRLSRLLESIVEHLPYRGLSINGAILVANVWGLTCYLDTIAKNSTGGVFCQRPRRSSIS